MHKVMYVWLHSLLCEKYCTLLHAHNVPLGTVLLPLSTFLKYKQQYVRSEAPTRHLHIYTAIIARWSHPTSNPHTGTTQDTPLHLGNVIRSHQQQLTHQQLLPTLSHGLPGGWCSLARPGCPGLQQLLSPQVQPLLASGEQCGGRQPLRGETILLWLVCTSTVYLKHVLLTHFSSNLVYLSGEVPVGVLHPLHCKLSHNQLL